jgi:hypothetical protein
MLQLLITNETISQIKKMLTTFEIPVTSIEQMINAEEDTFSW